MYVRCVAAVTERTNLLQLSRVFAELPTFTISFVMYVCLSVCLSVRVKLGGFSNHVREAG
jgi:hypothetical protein